MEIIAMVPPKSAFNQAMQAHKQNEILVCKDGFGVLTTQTQKYHLSPGDVVCIPAGVMHEDLAPEPRQNIIAMFDNVGEAYMDEVHLYHDDTHALEQLIEMAADALLQNTSAQRTFAFALGDAMLRLLQCWGVTSQTQTNEAVSRIDRLIRHNFHDADFDLAAEVEKTGYSEGYFRRLFRSTIGRPPQSQLNHVRIEYAKTQLRVYRSMSSIKRISQESGFRDPYYFSRVFKQYEGISPTQFLKTL